MSFIPLAPRVAPSRRGGIAIRLARPARGDKLHVEARFFIERPLALEAGIKPGDAASIAIGQGDDAGWVRLAAEPKGAFRFGRSGGKHGGGCVVSIGYTELFGREPGYHRVGREEIKVTQGALLLPLPETLRQDGGLAEELADRQGHHHEQAPGAPSAGTDEGRPRASAARVGDADASDCRPSSTLSAPPDTPPARPKGGEQVAQRSDAILGALEAHGALSPAELRSRLSLSKVQIRVALRSLVKGRQIVGHGGTRGLRYTLADAPAPGPRPKPVKAAKPQPPAPAPKPAPARPAAADPADLIARHIAEKGVTRCPPAYAAAITGAEDKPGRLPHYVPPTHEQQRQVRAGKAAARSKAMNSGRMA